LVVKSDLQPWAEPSAVREDDVPRSDIEAEMAWTEYGWALSGEAVATILLVLLIISAVMRIFEYSYPLQGS
jgi:hypothetical protein